MLYKNKEYECEVVDNGFEGEGICKIENVVVFVPNAIKGEKVLIKILKINKSFAFAKLEKILIKSKYREDPICNVFARCGGCNLQHLSYNEQLKIKQEQVVNCMKKENINVNIEGIIGMGIPYYYRNKVQYPIREAKDGTMKIGFYAKRSHDIVENSVCYIQDKMCDEIAKYTFNLLKKERFTGYNENINKGEIKHILVRRGYHTNEVMIVIVTNGEKVKKFDNILKEVTRKYKDIKSIVQNVNNSKENDILGRKNITLYGKEYITDIIGEYKYMISANSFYQVNPIQTEVLYNIVKENLENKKDKTILDLYSGVGTIGIFVSDMVKKVYGIEIVDDAVKMAKLNIKLNDIDNVTYICGEVEERINELIKNNEIDTIIVDPPRKGLDRKIIDIFNNIKCKNIIYVSCNPATLARDIKLLESNYDVKYIKPVDLFPQTAHVECVAVLNLKN